MLEFVRCVADLRREPTPECRVITHLILRITDPSVDQLSYDVSVSSVLGRLRHHPDQQHTKGGVRIRPPGRLARAVKV